MYTPYKQFYLHSHRKVGSKSWYVEVVLIQNGVATTIHTTQRYPTESKAIGYAKTFCDMNSKTYN